MKEITEVKRGLRDFQFFPNNIISTSITIVDKSSKQFDIRVGASTMLPLEETTREGHRAWACEDAILAGQSFFAEWNAAV